jgi:glycosyltransferase involved in cell wall biosynthesis
MPQISVIVPTRNNQDTIGACLRSLARQRCGPFEVIVINDASTDATLARAREAVAGDARFTLLSLPTRGGPAAARNAGIRRARGTILAFIDGDSWAEPDWLERLVAPLWRGEVDCTGGPDVVPRGDPLISRCIGYSMDSLLASGGLRLGSTRLVRYLPGTGNMALWRRIVDQVGPFNEWFHDSGEDKEFLYRVLAAGYQARSVPEARVWHHRTRSLATYFRKMYLSGLRRVDIWRLMPEAFEFPHLAPALLTLALLLGLPGSWAGPPLAALYGLLLVTLGAAVLADGVLGAWRLRDPRALFLVAITSPAVPLGYGLGILAGLLRPRPLPLACRPGPRAVRLERPPRPGADQEQPSLSA